MARRQTLARYALGLALLVGSLSPSNARVAQAADIAAQPEDDGAVTLPLTPVGAPGFVEINAVVVTAVLSCPDSQCRLDVTQRYQLHNRDRVQAAQVALGLGSPAAGLPAAQHRLLTADGAALGPSANQDGRPTWALTLAPDEQRTIQVVSQHGLGERAFIRWRWDMALLASWGQIISARVDFRLPQHITDDALFDVRPPPATFDGRELIWEYEALVSPLDVTVTLMAPPQWQRLQALSLGEDHYALAQHHLALYDAAREFGLAYADPFDIVVAELLAVLPSDANARAAHAALADLYLSRATTHEDLRLNYLVLAARELETLHTQAPQDAILADRLDRIYFDAATTASAQGDPAGALAYLHKAASVSSGQDPSRQAAVEHLTLRWAVDLALGGQVARAIEALQGVMSRQVQDELFRYAPPIVSARTVVELTAQQRTVRYRLRLYQPTQAATVLRLEALAARLAAIEGCQAQVTPDQTLAVTLTLTVTYDSLAELRAVSAAISQALAGDDLLASLVASPWRSDISRYDARRMTFAVEWTYEEQVDMSSLAAKLRTESQYVHWRLVELRNQRPTDEKAALENQLALLALREQAQMWDGLPSASYWTYQVAPPPNAPHAPASWLVPWGEVGYLAIRQRAIIWSSIGMVAGGVGLALIGIVGLLALRRR